MKAGFLRRGGHLATVAAAVIALTASAGVAEASVPEKPYSPGHHRAESSCGFFERFWSLAIEQKRVLDFVGESRVLRNQEDLDRLGEPRDGALYIVLSHQYNSIEGMGFAVINAGEGGPGKPTMLLYKPSRSAEDTTDPFGPDFPYTLVGWGYAGLYMPGEPPSFGDDPGMRCIDESEWFVHERSMHPGDTWWNVPVPPVEEYHGQDPGWIPPTAEECACVAGVPHPRLWDLHLWVHPWGSASVSMFNPGKPIPGFAAVAGYDFFFPEEPPAGSEG